MKDLLKSKAVWLNIALLAIAILDQISGKVLPEGIVAMLTALINIFIRGYLKGNENEKERILNDTQNLVLQKQYQIKTLQDKINLTNRSGEI